MRSNLYKVKPVDFFDEKLSLIVEQLQGYINVDANGNDQNDITYFDPALFKAKIPADLHEIFDDLYLVDVDEDVSQDKFHLEKELETVLFRLKAVSAKRRMLEISNKLKIAEKSNDFDAVKQLTSEFEHLKSYLVAE